jgi:uncharacterized pyridoxamine 5'-phosphate oxidase family protein
MIEGKGNNMGMAENMMLLTLKGKNMSEKHLKNTQNIEMNEHKKGLNMLSIRGTRQCVRP